jgi:3-deoxy-D-manno-octulosonic-acid transferase
MFKDLFLQGGLGGFDVTKLFGDSRYVWLASVLLNVRHLPSLASFIDMKRQLIIFVETELIPSLINQVQTSGNSKLVIDIIAYMSTQVDT